MTQKFLLIRYETTGTPVYESENGPDIGYNNISTGFDVLPDEDEALEQYADMETYRNVRVISEHRTEHDAMMAQIDAELATA